MSLKGTKTKENLEAAFAGESQANRRYLYFAQKEDIDSVNVKKNITGKKIKSVEVLIKVASDNQNQN